MKTEARMAAHLVQKAHELHALRLWETFQPDDAIAFEIPGHDDFMAACICGQEGEEFGTTLFRTGLPGLSRAFAGHDLLDDVDQMSLLVAPLREVPQEMRGLLETARWRGRRGAPAPHMFVKRPGKWARNPRPGEVRTMLYAVSALLAAHAAGDLEPRWCDAPEGVQLLRLEGPPDAPRYTIDWIVCEEHDADHDGELFDLAPASYEVRDGCWIVGVVPLEAGVRGDDRTVSALLVVDRDTGRIDHQNILLGHNRGMAAKSLLERIEQSGSMPRRIVFHDRALRELLEPTLAERGVACEYEPHLPEFERLCEELAGAVTREPRDPALQEFWADRSELLATLAEVAEERAPNRDRMLKRYFGSAAEGQALLEADPDPEELMLMLLNWAFLFYRARKGSKTVLERALDRKDLGPGARAIGEQLRAARPSLYRVERAEPPHVDLLDLASGEPFRAFDRAMSRDVFPGTIIPAVLADAPGFQTILPLGPALSPMRAGTAFELLESEGIPVTPDGLVQHAHFGGRLAGLAREAASMPELRNTEGHPLLLHTADFVSDDPPATADALRALPDIEEEPEAGRFVWLGGGDVQRGTIETHGNHFVLEVNSEERFESGRALLESCPGVRFVSVRTQEFDPVALNRETPPDDLAGIEEHGSDEPFEEPALPPEVREQIHDHVLNLQMEWLDTRIPAFGHKTPRELCKSDEGRRRVRFHILSAPTPHPSMAGEPMDRIRNRMLEELGLPAHRP